MKRKLMMWIIMLFLLVNTALALEQVNITHSWDCEDNLNDDHPVATGGYNMQSVGTLAYSATAKIGTKSCDMTANDAYLVSNYTQYTGANTIEAWIYITAWRDTNYATWVSTNETDAAGGMEEYAHYFHSDGRAFWQNAVELCSQGAARGTNRWYHVAISYSGTELDCWINGTFVNTITNDPTQDKPIIFGQWATDNLARGLNGYIDGMKIWNFNWTNADAAEAYNNAAGKSYADYGSAVATNFTITAIAKYWNTTLENFTAVINGTLILTANGSNITTGILSNDTKLYNITVSLNDYFNETTTSWNVTSNLQSNLTINHTILNVTAFGINGSQISTFNVTANSYNSTHSITTGTTTSEATMDLRWNETYNITIDASGHALFNNTVNRTMNNFFSLQNFTGLYLNQTIIFLFRDEETNNPVANVTLELISNSFSANYTTNPDSNITLSLITPEDYIVRYSATSYPERFYYFTLTSRSFNNITLYLVNGSSVSNITATVYDQLGDELEAARIEVLKYDVTNNSYVLREQAETNWQGKAILHLEKNSEFYRFNIRYPNTGAIRLTTEPTYIFDDSITFQINTEDDIAEDFYTLEGISYTLIFNDATNNFRLIYSDPTATTVTQACLNVDRMIKLTTASYNNSCLSATSGTILVGVEEVNGTTYVGKAYATFGGEQHFLDKVIKTFQQVNNTGNLGLFLTLLVCIVFAIVGYYLAGAAGAIMGTPLPMTFAALIGLIAIDKGIMIFIQVISLIIGFFISRRF